MAYLNPCCFPLLSTPRWNPMLDRANGRLARRAPGAHLPPFTPTPPRLWPPTGPAWTRYPARPRSHRLPRFFPAVFSDLAPRKPAAASRPLYP